MLGEFNDPLRYSFSVRASTGLINKYLDWKDTYGDLNSHLERMDFVNSIRREINQTIQQVMTQEQSQRDLYYLNQGFDGLLVQLNRATNPLHRNQPSVNPNVPAVTPANYDDVRSRTRGLHRQ